jgi:flagellum-specific peptidoglycan hydrolase FlgJ
MLSPDQSERLNRAARSAASCEHTTGVPAELTVAQWVLESSWGTQQPGNNCFGIKAFDGCYGVQLLQTTEVIKGVRTPVVEKFATFPTLDACFAKHASLLTTGRPYAQAWAAYRATHNLQAFVGEIAHVYATDPNYANILLRIIAMPEVKHAVLRARVNISAQ